MEITNGQRTRFEYLIRRASSGQKVGRYLLQSEAMAAMKRLSERQPATDFRVFRVTIVETEEIIETTEKNVEVKQ